MNCDRSVLTELLLRFVHLAHEVDESFAGLWDSLFWPVGELELTHGPRLTVLHSQPPKKSKENAYRSTFQKRNVLCFVISHC